MQALNSWLVNTERVLCSNELPEWRNETIADQHSSISLLENNIDHHGRVVTAVVNLCSVLQHDQDASQSQRDKQAVAAVRLILKDRWKTLCNKLVDKRQWLTDVASIWHQMRGHTQQVKDILSAYSREVQRAKTSYISVAMAESELSNYTEMLHEFTSKRDDLKLINRRYIYMNRRCMVDTSGMVKRAVDECNELWDKTYQCLQAVVRRLKHTCQVWKDYETSREDVLTELGALSLALKRNRELSGHVGQRLGDISPKINYLLKDGATYLLQRSSVTDAGRVETMVEELQTSVDTLKLELRPGTDEVTQVEAELESIISEQEVIDRELESPPLVSSPTPLPDSAVQQTSAAEEAQRRLNYIDQRIADAEKRAELNRKKKAASAANMSLAGKPLLQLSSLRHKPRSLSSSHLTLAPSADKRVADSTDSPFQRFMASRRTMGPSCRRRAVPQVTRTRSHSSDRQYRLRRDSSPLTRTSLAPGSTYSTQSAHSTISPVTRDELSSEQRTVLQKRQLEVDVRNLLSWLGEAEELSLRWAERVPGDLNSLGKLCAQYKDFYTRLQQQRSRVLSINIITSMDDSAGSELDSLNSRWEKIQEMMVRHRTRLQPRLVACKELERQIKKLSDSVTAIQLEVISEVSDVKSVESHLRRHYKAIKSHLSNLSPILAEYQPAEQLMDYLLIAEDKCKTLLKIED